MNYKKTSEHIVKKYISYNLSDCCLLFIKKFFYFCAYKLCMIFALIVTITPGTASEQTEEEKTTIQITPLNYLKQNGDLPVEYLSGLYVVNTELLSELSYDITYPFFSILKADTLVRKALHSQMELNSLNHLISDNKGVEYINQKKMIQLIKVPLFFWLIKEYSCFHDEKKPASSPAITIRGMLYDLECRTKNDPVAELVLEFLNLPLKITPSKSSGYHSVLSKFKQFTSQFLFAKQAEKSFSERLALLTSSPYTEEKNKQQRLLKLISSGYGYYKKYIFTSFEPDKSSKTVPVTSDYIMIPEEQSQQLLGVNYPAVNGADDTSATTNIMGVKFSDSSFTKAAALATLGLCLFPSAYAAMTPIISSSQCGINGVCSLHNSYSLSDKNFSLVLQHDSSGCYKLVENIHLNAQHELPVFQDCTNPFSGTLDTGNYTINTGNGTSPVFGCINKATITGRFDFCTSDNAYIPPVIAKQALNRNIINIQQADSCKIQHPVFGNITGDNNQITFSGESKEIRIAQGSGVIATRVSGNNNTITLTHGQSYDSPMISTAGGYNNTYYQQNMNITRLTDRYLLNHKLLIADHFTGNETNIIQNNIKATYTTMGTQNPNHETSDAQTGTVYGVHTNIDILPMPETIRLTNISENTEQRTVIENHGRLEVFKNGKWNSVCENTLSQKTANAACKTLGHTGAENEGSRLSLKNRLSVTKLESSPIHLNKQCTGYEKHMKDCNVTGSDISACPANEESLLSCFSGMDPGGVRTHINATGDIGIRLTDPDSASPDRFDTIRNRIGRVEFYDRSNTSFSLCSHGFNDTEANVICSTLGFHRGEQTFPQHIPLSESIPVRQNIWACEGTESHINQCSVKNVSYSDCTHDNDVFVKCFPWIPSFGWYFRLTDRHSTDEFRAGVTNTGVGRLEMLSTQLNPRVFVPFRTGSVRNNAHIHVCRTLGFDNGTVSHLTAKPLPKLCDTRNIEYVLTCGRTRPTGFCLGLIGDILNPTPCKPAMTNVVLFCTKNNNEEIPQIQMSSQFCSLSNHNSNNFFSEPSDTTNNSQTNQCPDKLWDIDGVQLPEIVHRQCNCIQQLDTTIKKDWLTAWQMKCKNSLNHCNCHLPYEKMLGIVTEDSRYKDVFLISRQNYLNSTKNTQGLVLVRKLFSDQGIQVLNPVSENLVTGTFPVNHITMDQHLLGLYPTTNDRDIQLFWSPLEQNNGTYHAETFNVNGKPLLLTQNSVFIKETNNQVITQYQLNSIPTNNNKVTFSLDDVPSENITLPEQTADVFMATLKNNFLYVAATSNNTDQIYVISYDTTTKTWSDDWQKIQSLTSNNITDYNMFINGNQIQFLAHGQVQSTSPVSISIPELGGCTSFSIAPEEIEAIPLETPLETPTMETETKKSTTNIALLSAIGPALCVTTAVGCCFGYCLGKMENHLYKIINKKNNNNAENQDKDVNEDT